MHTMEEAKQPKAFGLQSVVILTPFTIVMDFEGNRQQSKRRAFERQSTLFALEIADVVVQGHWSGTCSQQTPFKNCFPD
uniref:Uncharacterized protein n=1 Tax=Salix viminalis TaxID=40686 RepID=A0A6N2LM46_SALVM